MRTYRRRAEEPRGSFIFHSKQKSYRENWTTSRNAEIYHMDAPDFYPLPNSALSFFHRVPQSKSLNGVDAKYADGQA